MKTFSNSKDITKRVKYLLNSVNISFGLAQALRWRQLYRLFKKAQKISAKFQVTNLELKQLAKDITNSEFSVKKATSITKVFKIQIKEKAEHEEAFKFVPFIKPFITLFQDEYPLLLI